MEKITIFITGGGTAGHLYPGLSIAQEIKKRYKQADIFWVGTDKRREKEIVESNGIKFYSISSEKFPIQLNWEGIKKIMSLMQGIIQSLIIIRRYRPNLVIGMGAYSSVPFTLAAGILKIPVIIHEQNVMPGKANLFLSRFAQKIMVSFPQTVAYFDKQKVVITGNPVKVYEGKKDINQLYKELNLDPSCKIILVFGGSQGAEKINQAVIGAIPYLTHLTSWQILHITGKDKYEKVRKMLASLNTGDLNYQIVDYLIELPLLMREAKLVVCRAGASTCSELALWGKPAILIPLSTAAAGHQRLNAQALKEAGAAIILEEKDLSGKSLKDLILKLISNEEKLKMMGERAKKLAKPEAKVMIGEVIKESLEV